MHVRQHKSSQMHLLTDVVAYGLKVLCIGPTQTLQLATNVEQYLRTNVVIATCAFQQRLPNAANVFRPHTVV